MLWSYAYGNTEEDGSKPVVGVSKHHGLVRFDFEGDGQGDQRPLKIDGRKPRATIRGRCQALWCGAMDPIAGRLARMICWHGRLIRDE